MKLRPVITRGMFHAAGLEERGGQSTRLTKSSTTRPPVYARPANHQRHRHAEIVEVALAARHAGHAVVAADDDQRVVQIAGFFELLQQHAHARVPGLNLAHVVGKVGGLPARRA